jgi:hypothetical protein
MKKGCRGGTPAANQKTGINSAGFSDSKTDKSETNRRAECAAVI